MSGNAYPSLLSATPLPQNANDGPLTGTNNLTTGSTPSDQTETQVTLRQASVALEAVYRRIRQFRRSLQEVADSVSSGEHQSRPSADDNLTGLAPSGVREPSSLILQDSSYVSAQSQFTTVGPQRTRRLNRDLPPLTTLPPLAHDISSSSNSPASQTPYPHLSRSPLESWFRRNREFSADDAETTLGRRVAARESARASTPHSRRNSNPLTRFEGNLVQLVSTMEREFDNLRQQRSQLSRIFPPDTRSTQSSRRTTELRATPSRENSSPVNNSLVPPPDLLRRRLMGFPPSRSPTMSWSERLSLLSNFSSVQNLPTPVSTGSSRSLLFEEPTSYLQGSEDSHESRSDAFSGGSGLESDRSYVVRRRFNADGEEHVHPISLLEWPDEPLAFVGPERTVGQSEQPEAVPHRRRGWARLDSDGNEISLEQEEELERARSRYRLQERTADPGVHSTTSTSLTPDDDDGRIPRVRLNSLGRRRPGSVEENEELERHGLAKPFRPCPLPMPLEDMDWTPPPCKPLCVNRVSKHASFAGR